MPVTRIRLKNFTAFKDLEVEFSPGINALVGANGTGKTHLMKACYAACDATKTHEDFATKLVKVFVASGRPSGRVVQQGNGSAWRGATVEVDTEAWRFRADIDADEGICGTDVHDARSNVLINAVYIPVKEMLANAPGFLSLYALRDLHFEEVYQDILLRAYLPALRESVDDSYQEMLDRLQELIGGKITVIGEEFFLSNERGDLIFDLVAEGWRKLGLLWLLIRNGALQKGSVLFWDEPEANLNPQDVSGGDRGAAGIATGGGTDFLRHARLRDPQGAGSADDGEGRRGVPFPSIGTRRARSSAAPPGSISTFTPTPLAKPLMTFTIAKLSAAWGESRDHVNRRRSASYLQ